MSNNNELDIKFTFGWIPVTIFVCMVWSFFSWACDLQFQVGQHAIGCVPAAAQYEEPAP